MALAPLLQASLIQALLVKVFLKQPSLIKLFLTLAPLRKTLLASPIIAASIEALPEQVLTLMQPLS